MLTPAQEQAFGTDFVHFLEGFETLGRITLEKTFFDEPRGGGGFNDDVQHFQDLAMVCATEHPIEPKEFRKELRSQITSWLFQYVRDNQLGSPGVADVLVGTNSKIGLAFVIATCFEGMGW